VLYSGGKSVCLIQGSVPAASSLSTNKDTGALGWTAWVGQLSGVGANLSHSTGGAPLLFLKKFIAAKLREILVANSRETR
jgi:hypothetical protein